MSLPPFRFVLFLGLAALAAPSAHATRAIANWDVVPDQLLAKPFKCGVVAFHESGVGVRFKINGADAGEVKEPTLNDRTGVVEYWIEIDPAKYADGPITVAATAIPKGEGNESRQLADLNLYANHGGTLGSRNVVWVDAASGNDETGQGTEAAPFATIAKGVLAAGDGGTVYLKAGKNYAVTPIGGEPFQYWTTVTAAPGLQADDVHILTYGKDAGSTGRYGKSHLRWKNVSLFCDREPKWGSLFYFNKGDLTWFDGAVLYDKNGRLANTSLFNGSGARTFLTDTTIREFMNCGGDFQRNVRIENIGSDIYRGETGLTAINVTIRRIDRGDTEAHPDFIQFFNPKSPVENVILYNVKIYDMAAQGLFGTQGEVSDVAFVNLLIEKDPPEAAYLSQLSGSFDHVLLWNATIVDQAFNFRNSSAIKNFDPDHASIHIDSAHTGKLAWNQKEPLGANPTEGDPLFVDEEADDYRLSESSPAYQTGILCPGVPADIDGVPYGPGKPNRGAFAAGNPGPKKN